MNIRSMTVGAICMLVFVLIFASTFWIKDAHADDSLGDLITNLAQSDKVVEEPDPVRVELAALSSKQVGRASYYGRNHHGRKTASGQKFNMWGLSAAHKTLPFGTCLSVMNTQNGQSAIVVVNDRGPYVGSRVLDLSQGAATKIGMIKTGVATITYQRVQCPTKSRYF